MAGSLDHSLRVLVIFRQTHDHGRRLTERARVLLSQEPGSGCDNAPDGHRLAQGRQSDFPGKGFLESQPVWKLRSGISAKGKLVPIIFQGSRAR